ncbi:MAG: hypothetical protein M3Q07_03785 [Pseudobdellovibrionaceae bacterium]|nr:hypothetical protein [Pseudobdellovibrionaceae bacterium]
MQTGIVPTKGNDKKSAGQQNKVPHTTDKNRIDEIAQSSEPGRQGEGSTYVPPSLRTGPVDQELPNGASTGSGEYGLDQFLDKDAIASPDARADSDANQPQSLPDVDQILAGTPIKDQSTATARGTSPQGLSLDNMSSIDDLAKIQSEGLASNNSHWDEQAQASSSKKSTKASALTHAHGHHDQPSGTAALPEAEGYQAMQDELASTSIQPLGRESTALTKPRESWPQVGTGQTRESWNSLSQHMRQAFDRVDQNVKKKPVPYVIGALGVGFALAKIIV